MFYCILGFGALFGYGTGVVCYWVAPDWMWMYTLDSRLVPASLLVYLSIAYHLSFFAGIMCAREMLSMPRVLRRTLAAAWGIPAAIYFIFFNRIWQVGAFKQFNEGLARPMVSWHPIGAHPVLIIMGLIAVIALFTLWVMTRIFKPDAQA